MRQAVERHRFDIALEDLQTFLSVAQFGSFSRAAEYLNLSQPSVSNRVRRLEEKLAVRLLQRTSRKVELTKDGRRLQIRASEALAGLQQVLEEFSSEASSRESTIDVVTTLTIAVVALPGILLAFQASHPGLTVRLHDTEAHTAIRLVSEGRCEIAVMGIQEPREDLLYERLISDPCVAIAPLGHPLLADGPVTLAQVLRNPLVIPDGPHPLRAAVVEQAERLGLTIRFAAMAPGVGNVLTLLAMTAAGVGVTLFSGSLIPREMRSILGSVAISDFEFYRHYGLITARNRSLTPAAKAFRAFLISSVEIDAGGWVVRTPANPDGRKVPGRQRRVPL